MKTYLLSAIAGSVTAVVLTTQVAGPLLAQESNRNASVYEQLDLFGDIFERIMSRRSRNRTSSRRRSTAC